MSGADAALDSKAPSWLRQRRPGPGLDWGFVAYWAFTSILIGFSILMIWSRITYYDQYPDRLFGDARLYLAATNAWLSGGDPWATRSADGVVFAGPPPTLLLSLPLVPFGPEAARWFWAIASLTGWLFVMRRLHLAPWFLVFPPFIEGYFPGSPDAALFALILLGGGAVTAIAKPYSVPSMLADGRWLAVAIAGTALVVTLPFLPWGLFMAQLDAVRLAFASQSGNVSAWGSPILMVAVAVALLSLGVTWGLRLVVPALWPGAQLHYAMFSVEAAADSAFIAVVISIPYLAAPGIIVYAVVVRLLPLGLAFLRSRRPEGKSTS